MAPVFKTKAGGRAVHERYAQILAHRPVAHQPPRPATREGETFVAGRPKDGPAAVLAFLNRVQADG